MAIGPVSAPATSVSRRVSCKRRAARTGGITANDWRAIEAGAHAYAAIDGYGPLTTWTMDGAALVGTLELPLAMGIVGGTLQAHRAARFAIAATGVERGVDLARIAACAGLATNFAALRALVTDGIQAGHMPLQDRSR